MAIRVTYQFAQVREVKISVNFTKKSVEKGRKVGRFSATDQKVGWSFFDDRPQTLVPSLESGLVDKKTFDSERNFEYFQIMKANRKALLGDRTKDDLGSSKARPLHVAGPPPNPKFWSNGKEISAIIGT